MTMELKRDPQHGSAVEVQRPDADPSETQEWLDSVDAMVDHAGRVRARELMVSVLRRARQRHVVPSDYGVTDYVNTIPTTAEPEFPGDEDIERRIRSYVRWNAAVMVHRAQRPGLGVGGHISTYASTATLYEVGFNHFFGGHDADGGADQIYFQGHASPGIYSRAFLEGRLTAHHLDGFRQEISHVGQGGGLPSYPHPRLMPNFWEFTTVSMGLGPISAIYQARFNRYLHNRGIKDTSRQHVWAFVGDGEMDEPESLGALGVAAREGLDNLTFVVNCNLQRLDGPVRGNGKIIQGWRRTSGVPAGTSSKSSGDASGTPSWRPTAKGPLSICSTRPPTATSRPTSPNPAASYGNTSSPATVAPRRWSRR